MSRIALILFLYSKLPHNRYSRLKRTNATQCSRDANETEKPGNLMSMRANHFMFKESHSNDDHKTHESGRARTPDLEVHMHSAANGSRSRRAKINPARNAKPRRSLTTIASRGCRFQQNRLSPRDNSIDGDSPGFEQDWSESEHYQPDSQFIIFAGKLLNSQRFPTKWNLGDFPPKSVWHVTSQGWHDLASWPSWQFSMLTHRFICHCRLKFTD